MNILRTLKFKGRPDIIHIPVYWLASTHFKDEWEIYSTCQIARILPSKEPMASEEAACWSKRDDLNLTESNQANV